MDYQLKEHGIRAAQACVKLDERYGKPDLRFDVDSLRYFAWPEVYGSTAGPFGGIGGATMTVFTLEAWVTGRFAVIFCGNKIIDVVEDFEGPCSYKAKK